MAITSTVLERAGIDLPVETFEQMVIEAAGQMLWATAPIDARRALPLGEGEALARGGLDPSPYRGGIDDPLVRTAAEYAAMVASSMSVVEAAELLGVKDSRVRQRLGERTLYGIKMRAGWRLPRFQFCADGRVPGLDRVLPHLDPELHPVEVLAWLTAANPDLTIDPDDKPVAPLDWLRSGRSPVVVAELAAEA
ncbi:MAG: DNA-binding protein [Chloroflexota bacterium]|nr:MAG: DNA-binding protein [Chloroflexota bacterium]